VGGFVGGWGQVDVVVGRKSEEEEEEELRVTTEWEEVTKLSKEGVGEGRNQLSARLSRIHQMKFLNRLNLISLLEGRNPGNE
jgi:hypothetical protein